VHDRVQCRRGFDPLVRGQRASTARSADLPNGLTQRCHSDAELVDHEVVEDGSAVALQGELLVEAQAVLLLGIDYGRQLSRASPIGW
jgi:hypothetical protein